MCACVHTTLPQRMSCLTIFNSFSEVPKHPNLANCLVAIPVDDTSCMHVSFNREFKSKTTRFASPRSTKVAFVSTKPSSSCELAGACNDSVSQAFACGPCGTVSMSSRLKTFMAMQGSSGPSCFPEPKFIARPSCACELVCTTNAVFGCSVEDVNGAVCHHWFAGGPPFHCLPFAAPFFCAAVTLGQSHARCGPRHN